MSLSKRQYSQLAKEYSGPVLQDLEALGVIVPSIEEVEVSARTAGVIGPTVLRSAFSTRHPAVAHVLIRTMANPVAADIAIPQLAAFIYRVPDDYLAPYSSSAERKEFHDRVQMVVGSTLGDLVCPQWSDVFFALVGDWALGSTRFNIIRNLSRTEHSEVGEVLMDVIADSSVRNHAIDALGRLRYTPAISTIESIDTSGDSHLRGIVRDALQKMRGPS